MKIDFTVNGEKRSLDIDPMRRLLDVIREDLGLTGTKEGCGEGECGACSVLLDGKLINSCLIPIAQAAGSEVTTIEGVRESDLGRSISDAFAETHAVQCGFCTPGMMMAAAAYLTGGVEPTGGGARSTAPPTLSEAEIREAISGNICRCTGYDMIVDGIEAAARRLSRSGGGADGSTAAADGSTAGEERHL